MTRNSFFAVLFCAAPAGADITVSFADGAPTDRFEITNLAPCPTGPLAVRIDLAPAAGGLIFDTTEDGAGVSIFQPLRLADGSENVTATGQITDGDSAITLELSGLPGEGRVGFTVDVDDTLPTSRDGQIRVSGGEIAGARVEITTEAGQITEARFAADGIARVAMTACLS